jgi:serine/threonine-protein kinase
MSADGITALVPGASFHQRYRIVRRIKAGGMGAVYEVLDDRTNSRCALKVMLPDLFGDADLQARFALEAKITGDIVSDHLVRVSDAGIDEPTGTPFLVMELLLGEDLGRYLKTRKQLPPDEVVLFLHQAALALDKTHAAGIVHRDLKPDNLFVTYRDDGSPCVKILDFGVAKIVAQGAAHATRAVGTPLYMAPEQILGEASVGPRTDLFALGHIAYTLLVGEAFWIEEQRGAESIYPVLAKIAQGFPEAPCARAQRRRGVALPPAFDAWLARAAARRPEDRFDRATAQSAALAEALAVSGPSAPAPSLSAALRAPLPSLSEPPTVALHGGTGAAVVTPTPPPRRTRSMVPVIAGAVLAVALGAGAILALGAHGSGTTPAAGAVDPVRAAPSAVPLPPAPSPPTAQTAAAPPTAPPEPSATAAAAPSTAAASRPASPVHSRGPAASPARPASKPASPLSDGPGF